MGSRDRARVKNLYPSDPKVGDTKIGDHGCGFPGRWPVGYVHVA